MKKAKWKRCSLGLGVIVVSLSFLVGCGKSKEEKPVKEFTTFVAVPGKEILDGNRMQEVIAQKVGAKATVSFLTGQTAEEKIQSMINNDTYPDFIVGSDATALLLEAGAYIPLEDYIDKYENLKNYLTEQQWDALRQPDGHIYNIPIFGVIQGHDTSVIHSSEAFWIQKRVLKWANYPKIRTLQEYFDLIGAYLEANPTTDGQENIGFEILCDDWRYFCLENPPQFLAGYPNDGCAIVDPDTKQAKVYDTIPEAKEYYKILNEQYHKQVIDPETFMMTYNQYMEKITSGNVLGMIDQYWEFQDAQDSLYGRGKADCTYVPMNITLDESVTPMWNVQEKSAVPGGDGLGISVSCKDVEGALQFVNDLLDPEVMIYRYWGEEHIDYEVDEEGYFYRTEEQRAVHGGAWLEENMCFYSYFPHYEGLLADGKNAVNSGYQPSEYYASLSDYDKEVLDAYGCETWREFVGEPVEGEPWFPLYTATATWDSNTDYAQAKVNMEEVKRKWLPKVIMGDVEEFEQNWKDYMRYYDSRVDVAAYEEELTKEVKRRIDLVK